MYGDLAHKLIVDTKRVQQLYLRNKENFKIPTFQHELFNKILKEVNQLKNNAEYLKNQQIEGTMDPEAAKCQLFINLLCLERNKRCLLAYQKFRTDLLDTQVWDLDGTSELNGAEGQDVSDLSAAEQQYLKEYEQLITEMKSGTMMDIDLTGSLTPPNEIFIDVRVLRDAGEIQTEYGVFNLIKDSQFFVRQSDVERLIQQGYLQKL